MARNAFLLMLALVLAGVAGWAIWDSMPDRAVATTGKPKPVQQPGSGSAPAKAFADVAPPPAPDYSKANAWAARPNKKDYADLVPADEVLPDMQATADVDVFYIHPTTFRSNEAWVQNIADTRVNEWTDASVIARQAAIFNGCCRVFAPRYRQAAAGAVSSPAEGMKAYAFAYEDVKRAFKYYLDHDNKGRPFILVGHSQGTFHVLPLIEEMIDRTRLRDQLVAAYAIGIGVPMGSFGRQFKAIVACERPDQTGCLVSWNTFGRQGAPEGTVARQQQRYIDRYKTEDGKELMCINPLTFDAAIPDASADANMGALPGVAAEGPLPAVKPALIGATCRDGTLWADIPTDPDFVLNIFPGEMLHFHDMDLFFQNIRANAILRAQTWLRAHPRA